MMEKITFKRLEKSEYADFAKETKDIFSIAVEEAFGETLENDNDIESSLNNLDSEVFAVYEGDEKVGGIAVKADAENQCHWLDLFYIYPNKHGKGLGVRIMQGLEDLYPEAKVWRLITPYFEKRNIHFYVNKCGFKIVEFFNEYHRDPNRVSNGVAYQEEYFIFEKRIE
jgi:GNAT superfamily N-acetyltransferase